jgi:hypothetical protein
MLSLCKYDTNITLKICDFPVMFEIDVIRIRIFKKIQHFLWKLNDSIKSIETHSIDNWKGTSVIQIV